MNFDDNAIFRRPEILKLRDLMKKIQLKLKQVNMILAYIKLNGSIGCMVNGAGLLWPLWILLNFMEKSLQIF